MARTDKTTLKGNPVELVGTEINVGDCAPVVNVVATDLSDKQIGGENDKAQLVVVVPSLDTPVCDAETRRFNTDAASIDGIETVVVSMDLPFAGKRFCSVAGIENLTVASDFRNKDFSNAYGVLIGDSALAGVTCRAIFVIDKGGKVTYKQIVPEITAEPNFEEALAAATEAGATGASCCGTCD